MTAPGPAHSAETSARPFRHLCPEADLRDAMTDEQFWAHVYRQEDGPDYDIPEDYEVPIQLGPCPVCHELGACGYDAEGRPMIHVQEDGDDA